MTKNLLGSVRGDNDAFANSVAAMLEAFRNIDASISVKLHYLHSHLNAFHCDLQKVSDQHGERLHKTISYFERRFRNTSSYENMPSDFFG